MSSAVIATEIKWLVLVFSIFAGVMREHSVRFLMLTINIIKNDLQLKRHMWKIVCDLGRIAQKDNTMIFKYVVWLLNRDECKKYHVIEWDSLDEIKLNIEDYLVFEKILD